MRRGLLALLLIGHWPTLVLGGEPDARLRRVRNLVDTFTPERRTGQPDQALRRGDMVGTLSRSSAEVSFSDSTHIELGEQSLLLIAGEAPGKRGPARDTTLLSGELRAHLGELSGRSTNRKIVLGTPAAQIKIEPGDGGLAVDAKKTTRVMVYRGQWQVAAGGLEVRVPQGFGTQVERGKRPKRPRRLPAAPVWEHVPAEVTGRAVLRHGGAAGAARFRVQVARDEAFRDLVFDEEQAERVISVALLPADYVARVSTIDAEGLTGAPGAAAHFRVLATPSSPEPDPAPLDVPPPAAPSTVSPPAPASPPPPPRWVSAPVARPIPAPLAVAPRLAAELGFAGNLLFGATPVAGGFSLEAGVSIALPRGALAVSLRPAYEYAQFDGPLRTRVLGSLALTLAYRILGPRWPVSPYVLLAPLGLIGQDRNTATPPPPYARFGLLFLGGIQARLGPRGFGGSLYLEGGYRVVIGPEDLGGGALVLGYRHVIR